MTVTMINPIADLIHRALYGIDDESARQRFIEHFGGQIGQFETIMSSVYERWQKFADMFSRDQDSATVVGTLFTMISRLIQSMKLLMIGHITLAGAAKRQAIESIAVAFLFSKHGFQYLHQAWDGQFSENKAINLIIRHHKQLNLDKEALQIMKNFWNFYHKFSHPTISSMGDVLNLDGTGIFLGASFDENKLPFYEREVTSRMGLANILINIIEGVTRQMQEWPCFAQ